MINVPQITLGGELSYSNVSIYEPHDPGYDKFPKFFDKQTNWRVDGKSYFVETDDILLIQWNHNSFTPPRASGFRLHRLCAYDISYHNVFIVHNYRDLKIPNILGDDQIVFVCNEGTFIANKSWFVLFEI